MSEATHSRQQSLLESRKNIFSDFQSIELYPCYSKCGPGTSSSSIAWELVKNKHTTNQNLYFSQTPPLPRGHTLLNCESTDLRCPFQTVSF